MEELFGEEDSGLHPLLNESDHELWSAHTTRFDPGLADFQPVRST
jgi:hypothetical protein